MIVDFEFIPTAGRRKSLSLLLPETPSREQVSAIVCPLLNCVVLDRILVLHDGEEKEAIIDDCALIKRLPVNKIATTLYRSFNMKYGASSIVVEKIFIYGSVVLFNQKVWF